MCTGRTTEKGPISTGLAMRTRFLSSCRAAGDLRMTDRLATGEMLAKAPPATNAAPAAAAAAVMLAKAAPAEAKTAVPACGAFG